MIYPVEEDSKLLAEQVKKYSTGNVLDIGTGSGIQALTAAQKKDVKKVLAIDIQKEVIDHCKKNSKHKKITYKQSNLFQNIKNQKFDTIIFNPPYLPQDKGIDDVRLYGGKHGYELIEILMDQVNNYLNPNGIILLLFSSLSKKDKVDEFIDKNLLKKEQLSKKHVFFEDLYVYKIKKSDILKKIEKHCKNIEFLAKGKRGFVFKGKYKNKTSAIKIHNPNSSTNTINHEVNILKEINKHKIGPKLYYSDKEFFVMEFIKGDLIENYFKNSSKTNIKKIIEECIQTCKKLDKIRINKFEMTNPHKHIIIDKKPRFIDFERSRKTIKPKNLTQFYQYLTSTKISKILKEKGIIYNKKEIIKKSKKYKSYL